MHFFSSSEPKKAICSKQHNNLKNLDFRICLAQYISKFFEKHNLYIMWFYVLQFFYAKLYLFVFDAIFSASNWQFIGKRSCIISDLFLGF